MKRSSISRAERKEAHAVDCETQHKLWVVRIQEVMRDKGISAQDALEELKKEVNEESKEVWPVHLAQFNECWRNFLKRIERARM